jgi:hypothetical protein
LKIEVHGKYRVKSNLKLQDKNPKFQIKDAGGRLSLNEFSRPQIHQEPQICCGSSEAQQHHQLKTRLSSAGERTSAKRGLAASCSW